MKRSELKYMLEDIFQLKGGADPRESRRLAESLCREKESRGEIQSLTSYRVGETVLVIHSGPEAVKSLFLLDASSGKKRHIGLQGIPPQRAK